MARRGRKRKIVPREGNGRAQRGTPQEARVIAEAAVLAQPHRRNRVARDQRCSSEFGRFCLDNKLRQELYDAGEEYAATVRRWRAAKGIPSPFSNESARTGLGPSNETVANLTRHMIEMEQAMMGVGFKALLAVKQLTLDCNPLGMDQDGVAVDGLIALAVELGMMRAHAHPFEIAA